MKTTFKSIPTFILIMFCICFFSCKKKSGTVVINPYLCLHYPISDFSTWNYTRDVGFGPTAYSGVITNAQLNGNLLTATVTDNLGIAAQVTCNTNTGIVTSVLPYQNTPIAVDILKEGAPLGTTWVHNYILNNIPTRYDMGIVAVGGSRTVSGVLYTNVMVVRQIAYADYFSNGNYTMFASEDRYYSGGVGLIEVDGSGQSLKLLSYSITP